MALGEAENTIQVAVKAGLLLYGQTRFPRSPETRGSPSECSLWGHPVVPRLFPAIVEGEPFL